MYYKWTEWLNNLNTEYECEKLWKQKKEKKIEIIHQKYILTREELICSRIRSDLYKLQREYEELDLSAALIDGRFTRCAPKKETKKRKMVPKEDCILEKLKTLNTKDRERLLKQLLEQID